MLWQGQRGSLHAPWLISEDAPIQQSAELLRAKSILRKAFILSPHQKLFTSYSWVPQAAWVGKTLIALASQSLVAPKSQSSNTAH